MFFRVVILDCGRGWRRDNENNVGPGIKYSYVICRKRKITARRGAYSLPAFGKPHDLFVLLGARGGEGVVLEITNSELLGWKLVACFVVSSYRLKNSVAYTRIWQRFHVRKEHKNSNILIFLPTLIKFYLNTCERLFFR